MKAHKLLLRLSAVEDFAYSTDYNHKVRGWIYNALQDSEYAWLHDEDGNPGFCFSNPMPYSDQIAEGEEKSLFVSTVHGTDFLEVLLDDLRDNGTRLLVGTMRFDVEDWSILECDVGEPGSSGVLETQTGVLMQLDDETLEEHGIDSPHEKTYWKEEHGYEPFVKNAEFSVGHRSGRWCDEVEKGRARKVFDAYDLEKTYAVPKTLTNSGHRQTLILSKWRLHYRVRDEMHRSQLNAVLGCGIGAKSSLGLGFLQRRLND